MRRPAVLPCCLLLLAGAVAAAAQCVQNPVHPFDAEYDSGEPGWVDLGGCFKCSPDNSTCLECWPRFSPASNGTCVMCEDSSCAACDGDRPEVCKDCTFDWEGEREVGAYADKEGKCVDCPTEGCMVCMNLNGTCTDCTTARGLVGGSCKQCVDKECLSCDGDVDTCIQCFSGSFVKDGKCAPCSAGCSNCTDATTCLECDGSVEGTETGLWLDPDNTTCVPCSEGCMRCPDGIDTCEYCQTGYTNTTEGLCIKCTDPHCTTCAPEKPDSCEICAMFNDANELQWGADPVTGTCVDCKIEHCASCQSNSDICDWCKDGWWNDVKLGKCTPCKGANCVVCATDGDTGKEVCSTCADGFELDYEADPPKGKNVKKAP